MPVVTNTPSNDTLMGGIGNDTYVWGRGSGNDIIIDQGGFDTLHINATISDISLTADTDDGSLFISLNGKSLTIRDYFNAAGSGPIEKFVFGDGSQWGLQEILAALAGNPPPPPLPSGKVLTGTDADDVLVGTDFGDTISGGAGTDLLEGGYGDDVYLWSPGHGIDVVRDYGGNDKIKINATADQLKFYGSLEDKGYPLLIKFGEDQLAIEGYFSAETFKNGNVENLVFSDGSVWTKEDVLKVLIPVELPPTRGKLIVGTEAADVLRGTDYDDTINGASGDDAMLGGKGNDVYIWGPVGGSDLIEDEGGADTFRVECSSDDVRLSSHLDGTLVISLNRQTLTIRNYFGTGENGRHIENIVFSDGVVWDLNKVLEILNRQTPPPEDGMILVGTDADDILSGTQFGDTIDGAAGDDKLLGSGGDDNIAGGAGNDLLDGGTGRDLLTGGQGDDTYIWSSDSGSDLIEDSSGTDVVRIGARSSAVTLSADTDDGSLMIRVNGETLQIKNYFNQVGIPENRDLGHIEELVFTDGTVWDLAKVLEVLADPKPDPAPEPEGEIIVGQKNNDVLVGTVDDDTLIGGIGHDTLDGGAGNDILVGGQGKDVLRGGAGEDFFIFMKKADLGTRGNRDTITDFETGIDFIDLGKLDANSSTKKNDAFKALLKGKAAFTKAGQLHYDSKTGILSGNTDKDAQAEFQILFKNKPKVLHLDDFVL